MTLGTGLLHAYRRARARMALEIQRRPRLQELRLRLRHARRLESRLRKQLRFRRETAPPVEASAPRVFVALVESAHYLHFSVLALAKALQLRGAQVTVLFCGSSLDGCEVKSARNRAGDPCLTCRFNERHIGRAMGLDIVHIADFFTSDELRSFRNDAAAPAAAWPAHLIQEGIDIIPMANDSVTRHFYGSVPDDPATLVPIRRNHLASAKLGVELAKRIERRYAPDVVLSHMYVYTDWEPYYRYFTSPGRARFMSIGISSYDYRSVVVSEFELYGSSARFEKFVAARAGRPLDQEERAQLAAFIDDRVTGKARVFQDLQFFEQQDRIAERLHLDRTKRNVFLFSNIYWDIGMSDTGGLFKGVVEWVLSTIELLKDDPRCHLYIKPHPGEVYDTTPSAKGIAAFVRDRYPTLPPNISIISPEMRIPTYDLFPLIDLGVVYNGTLGLEMLMKNVPVVIAGKAPYGRLGFAAEPATLEAYRAVLTGAVKMAPIDRGMLDLFAYFYFIKKHIPWRLTQSAYADDFRGYTFDSLDDILPGRDRYLDHLCDAVLNPDTTIEGWTDESGAHDDSRTVPGPVEPGAIKGRCS